MPYGCINKSNIKINHPFNSDKLASSTLKSHKLNNQD